VAISDEQHAKLLELLTDAANHSELTRWESDFVADFTKKLSEWGERINVSPRQWDVFERLSKKVYAT
jgi:hypothetical protein